MQCCPDELIRDIGPIELGGIDVIDAEFCGAPQNRNRLAVVSRRPEYPGTWQLHGAEADA
jgi:site-specific DNA-cytosine methylase